MTQFKAFDPEIEVSGVAILSVIKGFGIFEKIGAEILAKHGLKNINPLKWYSQQNWLNAVLEIFETIGSGILFEIGKSIPNAAFWPSNIEHFVDALKSIDIAYHINHRKSRELLYNVKTGEMKEGIGHYKVENIKKNSLEVVCDNPYPCDFDMGIITGVAEKYKPPYMKFVKVKHSAAGCRKYGNLACIYIVSWQ